MEYRVDHIGINAGSSQKAEQMAGLFKTLFGFAPCRLPVSHFAGDQIEIMHQNGRGQNGHIGIAVADISAAMAELTAKGVTFDLPNARYGESGRLYLVYTDLDIGGFAVHLIEKK